MKTSDQLENPKLGPPLYEECFEIAEKVIERDFCHMTTYAFDFERAHFSDRNLRLIKILIFEVFKFQPFQSRMHMSSCDTDLLRGRLIYCKEPTII